MKTWSFFRPETGEILDGRFSGPADALAHNTPQGSVAIEGTLDNFSQRVLPDTQEVVDWQPPQPSVDHEWIGRRWVLKANVADRRHQRAMTIQKIKDWEEKYHRPRRELDLNPDNVKARERMQQIDEQIALLRATLNG